MRDPLSDKIKKIEPSGIRKFFDIVNEMKDAISLGVGEPDFDTPWHIREEGIYSLEHGKTFYTSNAGLKELKVEIASYLSRRFDLHYDYNKEITAYNVPKIIENGNCRRKRSDRWSTSCNVGCR